MTPHLPPYPVHRPSGVEWLGDVPAHWEVQRLRSHVVNIADQTNELGPDEIYLALENIESWTGRFLQSGNLASFDSQVKRFQIGDVLFGKLRPYLAKVTSPSRNGVCVGEFLVLRCRDGNLLSGYLERFLRSKSAIDAIDASTFGAKMPRADWQFIGGMKFPLPPLAEQRAIVCYLDHVDRRIQRYIEAKEKLIALLQEARQATIQRAVTRGLDPNVPLKSSGVDWLGDVPAHWEVRPNRAIFIEVNDQNHSDAQMLSVTITRGVIRQKELLEDRSKKDASRLDRSSYKLVQPGDIAYNKMRAWQGALGVSDHQGIVSPAYVVQRPRTGCSSRFLHYLLRTPMFAKEAI